MVRTKATPEETAPVDAAPPASPGADAPVNSLAAPPAPPPSAPLTLRCRGPAGVLSLALRTTSTLADFVAAAERQLAGAVAHASFRGADGRPVTLLSDGAYPAGGALLIGPHTPVALVGLDASAVVNVQVAAKKKPAKRAKAPKAAAAKRRKAADDDDDDDGDGDYVDDGSGDEAEVKKLLCGRAHAVLSGGAAAGDDASTVAAAFVNANESSDGLMGAAASQWVSQQGALRVEAASKAGLVRVVETPAKLKIFWKTSTRAKKETEESVRKFSPAESIAVVAAILHRQAGSNRRKLAGDKPSTRLLTPPAVASRCPALFWSLYASSRPAPDEPGDVVFALDHVLSEALAKYRADVDALRAAAEA